MPAAAKTKSPATPLIPLLQPFPTEDPEESTEEESFCEESPLSSAVLRHTAVSFTLRAGITNEEES